MADGNPIELLNIVLCVGWRLEEGRREERKEVRSVVFKCAREGKLSGKADWGAVFSINFCPLTSKTLHVDSKKVSLAPWLGEAHVIFLVHKN